MRQLTVAEYKRLDYQYSQCGEVEGRDAPSGEHMILMSLLGELGFRVMSKSTAMETAEQLLCQKVAK